MYRITDSPDSHRVGWCYLLTHIHMYRLVKIGSTRKHPIQRATELSAGTGVPGQFTVAFYRGFDDAFEAERLCHDHFADLRVDPSREFFNVEIGEVITFIRSLSDRLPGSGKEGGDWIENGGQAYVPRMPDTPWADLFASFPDDGSDRTLTREEQAQCWLLREKLKG